MGPLSVPAFRYRLPNQSGLKLTRCPCAQKRIDMGRLWLLGAGMYLVSMQRIAGQLTLDDRQHACSPPLSAVRQHCHQCGNGAPTCLSSCCGAGARPDHLQACPYAHLQNMMKLGHNKRDVLLDIGANPPGVQYGHQVLLLCSLLYHLLRAAVPMQQVLAVAAGMASVHHWQHYQLCELW